MQITDSFNRIFLTALLVWIGYTPAIYAALPDGLAQEPRPDSWKLDAALTDVVFIDRLQGWAVGSQGTLLRTEDGGKTWGEGNLKTINRKVAAPTLSEKFQDIRAKKQLASPSSKSGKTPFSCRFESVWFADAKNGWAAGGYDLPYLNHSRAVIARTTDGGKSWQSLPQLMIPRIHKIAFPTGMQRLSGWAIGASDPATNSALSFTSDAGNIWSSQKTKRMPNLIDAESTGNRFVGIDAAGQLATFDTAKFEYLVLPADIYPVLADVAMAQKTGWAVGSDGTVLTTENSGLSWSAAAINQALLATFDFRCVEVTTDKVWFAGDPGHVLFSMDRKTNQLEAHKLPRGVAINKICFVDDAFGWAVGDFGKIFATQDGGQTWNMQRSGSAQGNSHTGMLAICKNVNELPLELIGRHAGEDGKLIGVAIQRGGENFDAIRLAAERVGAAVVAPINTTDDSSDEVLLRKTVRTIRLWKPSIIIGSETRFVEQAAQLAADENAYPQQIATGLTVWQPKFMVVTDPNGPIEFDNDVFLARMGTLLEDVVLPSRMICGLPMHATGTAFFAWKLISNGTSLKRTEVTKNPFLHATLIKRRQNSIPLGSLSAIQKIGQKRQRMNTLVRMPVDSVVAMEQCKRAIAEFTFGLNTDRTGSSLAGVWLLQLADQYVQAGDSQKAAWALEQLATSLPNHCFAPLASATLARYYSSAEHNHLAVVEWENIRANIGQASRIPNRHAAGQPQVAIEKTQRSDGSNLYTWSKVDLAAALEEAAALPLEIDVEEELKDFDPATVDLTLIAEEPEVDQTTQAPIAPLNSIEIEAFSRQRNRSAANYFSRLGQRDPGLLKRAEFQFLQAHIVKQLGGESDAEPYYRNVLKAKPNALFSPAASDEMREDNSSLTTEVIAAAKRPHLDGLPNDPVWTDVIKASQTIKLPKNDDSPLNDIAMVAYDREYIYVYVRCYKSDRISYKGDSNTRRLRDSDLTNHDRVEIEFDVDRDLLSSWSVAVDYRGQVLETCGTAKSWNPKMYVAKHQDDQIWSIEYAIPLKDLAENVKPEDEWRLNIRRVNNRMAHGDGVFWGVDLPAAGSLLKFR